MPSDRCPPCSLLLIESNLNNFSSKYKCSSIVPAHFEEPLDSRPNLSAMNEIDPQSISDASRANRRTSWFGFEDTALGNCGTGY